jgi:hypothetical protein
MESVTAGTFVGAGSFRCERCDYTLTLEGSDILTDCPGCGSASFTRASMFATERISPDAMNQSATLVTPVAAERDEHLATARSQIERPGDYLCYEDGDRLVTVALSGEWTRIGRSLAADVRFDDPTVSRRHALLVRAPDGVRVLDDRSLNGVFVNGQRVEWSTLAHGDEILVGRYRLHFARLDPLAVDATPVGIEE